MKSAQKLAKLVKETGNSKPLAKYLSRTRSQQAKAQWSAIPKAERRKPKTSIKLSRRANYAVMKEWDLIATEAELYRQAFNAKLYSLCWEMRENIKDRLFGKPFVSTNPDEADKINALYQDNRLQIAQQVLLPSDNYRPVVTPSEPKLIESTESKT